MIRINDFIEGDKLLKCQRAVGKGNKHVRSLRCAGRGERVLTALPNQHSGSRASILLQGSISHGSLSIQRILETKCNGIPSATTQESLGLLSAKASSENMIYFSDSSGGLKSLFRIALPRSLLLFLFSMYWKIKGSGGEKRQ